MKTTSRTSSREIEYISCNSIKRFLDVFHRDITATCPNGGKTLMSQQEERQEVAFQYNLSHNTTGLTDEVNMLRLTVHR